MQLLARDLEEERLRFGASPLSGLMVLFLLGLGFVFVAAFIVLALGSAHPLAVAGALAAAFLAGGVAIA